MFWGIIFIVIGVSWLMQSLGFIPESVNWFWPAILIAIGISILISNKKDCCGSHRDHIEHKN